MVENYILIIPSILLALTIHEYAHAWMANRFGDPTSKMLGRLSLNPFIHLDPIGTLMLFLVGFGWAKPVPVDIRYFVNPKRMMLWVALAGPLSNIFLALIFGLLIVLFSTSNLMYNQNTAIIGNLLVYSLQINLALAFFNMFPIPPLDGSKILRGILSYEFDNFLNKLEQLGPIILIGIILIGYLSGFSIIWYVISPLINLFSSIFTFGLL
tara:strand:+ start:676 stop:1308 length:633 start_codon:yes stop_codon:yes gene_type:complete